MQRDKGNPTVDSEAKSPSSTETLMALSTKISGILAPVLEVRFADLELTT